MGRKVEKNLSKDKTQSSASASLATTEEDTNKTPEPYVCTGHFQTDFAELARRNELSYVPAINPRPKPPPPPVPIHEQVTKPEKGKDKNKQPVIPEPEPEPILDEDENGDPLPKTYTVKDKFEYFKPSIQVEMESLEKLDTVTEVFIRGWKIDDSMMNIFRNCWPSMEKLHSINLWQVGLTGETLSTLATFLPLCANVKTLILDGNWMKDVNWYQLIDDDNNIQTLSLQHCAITDEGAALIGRALGTTKRRSSKLYSLNLTGNRLTDVGAAHIAGGLRMNRALLSLSLANNQIGDAGVKKIAEALSRFPLTHEEVVERRKLLSEKGSSEVTKSPPPSRRAESKDRPGSVRSTTLADKESRKREKPSAKKSKETKVDDKKDKTKKEEKELRGSKRDHRPAGKGRNVRDSPSIAGDAGKTTSKPKAGKKDGKKQTPQEQEVVDVVEVINPLLEVADYIAELETLVVAGNRVLINLNLARNLMTEEGVKELIKAMQYQATLLIDSTKHGTGLMRISIHKNQISQDCEEVKKLTDMMVPKDPFYKPPITPEVEAS